MLELFFLGSGSSGNATIIKWNRTAILLDCGFSGKEIGRRAASLGLDLSLVEYVLISHEHQDHVRGLAGIARQEQRKIFCTEQTSRAIYFGKRPKAEKIFMDPGNRYELGEINISSFRTSHDARDPVGFVFCLPDGTRLGVMTDTGCASSEAKAALKNCEFLAIEANHDVTMLKNGPYPWYLKQRILSDQGHMSNEATVELLGDIGNGRLKHLFAMHLSRTNNTPAKARAALRHGLDELGLGAGLTVIEQHKPERFPPLGQISLL